MLNDHILSGLVKVYNRLPVHLAGNWLLTVSEVDTNDSSGRLICCAAKPNQQAAVIIQVIIKKHTGAKIRKPFSTVNRRISGRNRTGDNTVDIYLICKNQFAVINSSLRHTKLQTTCPEPFGHLPFSAALSIPAQTV